MSAPRRAYKDRQADRDISAAGNSLGGGSHLPGF